MDQKTLIRLWLEDTNRSGGEIIPSRMGGEIYRGEMFGSSTPQRCSEMEKAGILEQLPYRVIGKSRKSVYRLAERKEKKEPIPNWQKGQLFQMHTNYR